MKELTLDHNAFNKIKNIVERKNHIDQVVVLVDVADARTLMNKIKDEFLQGSEKKQFISKARKRYSEIKDKLNYHVAVLAYENKNFNPEDLVNINGFTFILCSNDRKMLRGFTLTYENNCFLFKKGNNIFKSLQSITSRP